MEKLKEALRKFVSLIPESTNGRLIAIEKGIKERFIAVEKRTREASLE